MTEEFKLDFQRAERIGLDEAVFCEGKTADQISAIVDAAKDPRAQPAADASRRGEI